MPLAEYLSYLRSIAPPDVERNHASTDACVSAAIEHCAEPSPETRPNNMTFEEAIEVLTRLEVDGNAQTLSSQEKKDAATEHVELPEASGCYYLKDWHAAAMAARLGLPAFYTVPCFFADDWLNGHCQALHRAAHKEGASDEQASDGASDGDHGGRLEEDPQAADGDDYRFVYVGPAGSWTPFHRDVFGSFSWSTNVCGRKLWFLFPPDEGSKLHAPGKPDEIPYDVRKVGGPGVCYEPRR